MPDQITAPYERKRQHRRLVVFLQKRCLIKSKATINLENASAHSMLVMIKVATNLGQDDFSTLVIVSLP